MDAWQNLERASSSTGHVDVVHGDVVTDEGGGGGPTIQVVQGQPLTNGAVLHDRWMARPAPLMPEGFPPRLTPADLFDLAKEGADNPTKQSLATDQIGRYLQDNPGALWSLVDVRTPPPPTLPHSDTSPALPPTLSTLSTLSTAPLFPSCDTTSFPLNHSVPARCCTWPSRRTTRRSPNCCLTTTL